MSVAQAARVGSLQTVEAALLQPSADVNGWGCQLLLWLADVQISMKSIRSLLKCGRQVHSAVLLVQHALIAHCARSLCIPKSKVYSADQVTFASRLVKGESTALHIAVRPCAIGFSHT